MSRSECFVLERSLLLRARTIPPAPREAISVIFDHPGVHIAPDQPRLHTETLVSEKGKKYVS